MKNIIQVLPAKIHDIDFSRPVYGRTRKRAAPALNLSSSSGSSLSDGDLWDIVSECAPSSVALQVINPPRSQTEYNIGKLFTKQGSKFSGKNMKCILDKQCITSNYGGVT